MFFLSLIPYFSTFVAENFYSFIAQACYGIDFMIIPCLSIITSNALKEVDKANVALQLQLKDNFKLIATITIVGIGMVIGYLVYPPATLLFIKLVALGSR